MCIRMMKDKSFMYSKPENTPYKAIRTLTAFEHIEYYS